VSSNGPAKPDSAADYCHTSTNTPYAQLPAATADTAAMVPHLFAAAPACQRASQIMGMPSFLKVMRPSTSAETAKGYTWCSFSTQRDRQTDRQHGPTQPAHSLAQCGACKQAAGLVSHWRVLDLLSTSVQTAKGYTWCSFSTQRDRQIDRQHGPAQPAHSLARCGACKQAAGLVSHWRILDLLSTERAWMCCAAHCVLPARRLDSVASLLSAEPLKTAAVAAYN
jgi:hypothetical protein